MYAVTPYNLLTFDTADGGLGSFVGWVNAADGSPHAGNGDQTLTLAEDTGISSVAHASGSAVSPMRVTPGLPYTAGVTCTGLVVISLLWVSVDGEVSAPVTGYGDARASATGVAPPNTASVIIDIFAPTATVTGSDSTTITVTEWDIADVPGHAAFVADGDAPAPVLLSAVVLVQGSVDPGALDPVIVDTTFGQRVYASLPELYTEADKAVGLQLSKWLHGMYAQVDDLIAVSDSIRAGSLTDPAVIDDQYLPWLAQMVGVPAGTLTQMRQALTSRPTAPGPGTAAAVASVGKQFLTGTKLCQVSASKSTAWTLVIRVRSDELSLVTDVAGLKAAMLATGLMPAGFTLLIQSGLPLWSDVDTLAGGNWAPLDALQLWAKIDSIGVSGT